MSAPHVARSAGARSQARGVLRRVPAMVREYPPRSRTHKKPGAWPGSLLHLS